MTINDMSVTEGDSGNSQAVFTVSLDQPATEEATVQYHTQDGTATSGQDYQPVSGELVFQPGEVTKTISVPIVGDDAVEPSEAFQVVLEQPIGATLASATGTGTIVDDDAPAPMADVDFAVVNDWNAGFQGEIEIRNESTTHWDEWTLQFTFSGDITRIWNAVIVSHIGDTYVIRGAAWNTSVRAGGTTSFGFIATLGGEDEPLSDLLLNGNPL
jgi:cellulase/cellobiase CelA1